MSRKNCKETPREEKVIFLYYKIKGEWKGRKINVNEDASNSLKGLPAMEIVYFLHFIGKINKHRLQDIRNCTKLDIFRKKGGEKVWLGRYRDNTRETKGQV